MSFSLDSFLKIAKMAPVLTMTQRNNNAGIAQLVERNLAKVEVASSRLVSRSRSEGKARFAAGSKRNPDLPFFTTAGGMAEWSCSGLQSRGRRFDSDSRLHPLFALHFGNNTGPRGSRIAPPMVPAGGGFVSVLSTFQQ